MRALIPQRPRSLPVWLSAAIWLAVLLSPTVYVLLVIALCRLQMPPPPEWLVVALFCLIPVIALLVCGAVVWWSRLRVRWRVGWLFLTVLAMSFQVGGWWSARYSYFGGDRSRGMWTTAVLVGRMLRGSWFS